VPLRRGWHRRWRLAILIRVVMVVEMGVGLVVLLSKICAAGPILIVAEAFGGNGKEHSQHSEEQ